MCILLRHGMMPSTYIDQFVSKCFKHHGFYQLISIYVGGSCVQSEVWLICHIVLSSVNVSNVSLLNGCRVCMYTCARRFQHSGIATLCSVCQSSVCAIKIVHFIKGFSITSSIASYIFRSNFLFICV
jgi:hypothetical protein